MTGTDIKNTVTPAYLSGLLDTKITEVVALEGGRNSRAYMANGNDGRKFAIKSYLGLTADGRSRMDGEYTALTFLAGNGVANVPSPVKTDPELQLAVYEFIEGMPVRSSEVTDQDIDQSSEFLAGLYRIKDASGSADLPTAAEACFSLGSLFENIQTRLDRVSGSSVHPGLKAFLDDGFSPTFEGLKGWSTKSLSKSGMTPGDHLSQGMRTLSPSDFGFHNCLRVPGGSLAFLDFEYFGWDDPAKMVSDFLLHPGMDLTLVHKHRFLDNIPKGFSDYPALLDRTKTMYPLYALKWSLILLNEFIPEVLNRRGYANLDSPEVTGLQQRQLAKSKKMLNHIKNYPEGFPYDG
jgi:hypothetical protein